MDELLKKKKPRVEKWFYQNRIKPLLKELKCRFNRIENTVGQGIPDVDLTHKGVSIKYELKICKGLNRKLNISEDQTEWHRKEIKAGGNVYILAYLAETDTIYRFKLEPEKYKVNEYPVYIIEKAEDLVTL